ncbi:hypothetical protein QN388_24995, partial [Pseudomonas sp. 5B4]|nr:hypothetical protein [Pseudomonas sp. 5B4]
MNKEKKKTNQYDQKISENDAELRKKKKKSFCHAQLANPKDALCVFGHALGKQDAHIVDAIKLANPKTIAFSIAPRSQGF